MGGPNRTEDIDFVKWKREISPPQESHRRNLCWNRTTKIEWHDVRAARVALANSTNGSYTTKPATLTVCCAMFCFVLFRFAVSISIGCACVCAATHVSCDWGYLLYTQPHTHSHHSFLVKYYCCWLPICLTLYCYDYCCFHIFFRLLSKINTLGCVAIWMQLSVSMIEKAIETF